jgi:hypothetical protein
MARMAKFSASELGTGENFGGGNRSSGDCAAQMYSTMVAATFRQPNPLMIRYTAKMGSSAWRILSPMEYPETRTGSSSKWTVCEMYSNESLNQACHR